MFKIKKIFKDSFILNTKPNLNYGLSRQLYLNKGKIHDEIIFDDGFEREKEHPWDKLLDNEGNPIRLAHETRSLIGFNTQEIINAIPDITVDTVKLRMYISNARLKGAEFGISAHPISKPWVEGVRTEFFVDDGVTWNRADNFVNWDNVGGDYSASTSFSVDINYDDSYVEVDILPYIQGVIANTIEDNGMILIPQNENYNFSMFSNQTMMGIYPLVMIYHDDYLFDSFTNLKEYEGNSDISIDFLGAKSVLDQGDTFYSKLKIHPVFPSRKFVAEPAEYYLPNLQYRIESLSTDSILVDYSDYTKVSVGEDRMYLKFSTENFPKGRYSIQCRHIGEEFVVHSSKFNFIVR